MERSAFIRNCCAATVGLPAILTALDSCTGLHYAAYTRSGEKIVVPRAEFVKVRKGETIQRDFVILELSGYNFPLCIYRMPDDVYSTCLLCCTHKSCELNVGGGIYSCPCHGSEFSTDGKVIQGPAIEDLKKFRTEIDNENIYVYPS